MTLFERAQRIAERASNLGNTEEIQQQVDELAAKHDVLKEKLQQLTAATQHASVLRKKECITSMLCSSLAMSMIRDGVSNWLTGVPGGLDMGRSISGSCVLYPKG